MHGEVLVLEENCLASPDVLGISDVDLMASVVFLRFSLCSILWPYVVPMFLRLWV